MHPHLAGLGPAELLAIEPEAIAAEAELVFCALPNGGGAPLVAPSLLEAGCTVIDLSGDHRLAAEDYPVWYGFEHPSPAWLGKAVYGLPELFGDRLLGAKLVASPGLLRDAGDPGLRAAAGRGARRGRARSVVDGKTGISGAGRGVTEATSFAATDGSIRPYRVPRHQHTPEIERGLELASGADAARAVRAAPGPGRPRRGHDVLPAPAQDGASTTRRSPRRCAPRTRGRAFVRVLAPGGMVDAKRTRGTNADRAAGRRGSPVGHGGRDRRAIDNLIKGAAGQAIQNANLVHGLDEATALPTTAVYP